MPLRATCDDHHFASSVERTSFRCRPPDGKKIEELKLEVTDNAGTVVHKADWSSGTMPSDGKFLWDGEDTESPPLTDSKGHLIKRYVNPLGSPFTATFTAKLAPAAPPQKKPQGMSSESDGGKCSCPYQNSSGPKDDGKEYQTGSDRVRVLYREIKLEALPWLEVFKTVSTLPDGTFPAGGTLDQKKMWLAYKLNELGYVAGPVLDPPVPDSLMRALFRYTQAHPELPKIVHYDTLTAGPAGSCNWGWRALWEAKFGTLDQLCTGGVLPDADDLLHRLQADERPRSDLVETPAALCDRSKETRVILDHDIHYLNKNFLTPNANVDYDREFLNRVCLSFRAKVLLVSRKDASATKPGVEAPKGVGPVECDWFAYDPPDDLSVIPPPVQSQSPFKTRARAYVHETHVKLAGNAGDELNALDNCPVELGGVRAPRPEDMSVYFSGVPNPQLFPGSIIYFQGSYIAGDNHFIQAALSLEGVPHAGAIKRDHQALRGLADAFEDPKPLGSGDPDVPLTAQSGRMTLWRRHRVLREVIWDSRDYPAIKWAPIVENYRAAHVILVPPTAGPIKIDALFTAASVRDRLVDAILNGVLATGIPAKEFVRLQAKKAFSPSFMYPVPFPTLAEAESLYPPKPPEKLATDPNGRWVFYKGFLQTDLGQWPGYGDLVGLSRALREAFDELKLGQGIIILRANFFGEPDFAQVLPPDVFRATKKQQAVFALKRGVCTGMDYGVVMLDRENSAKYNEAYLVTHEISHCLFGSHPFEVASKEDHDRGDPNCLMNYNINGKGNAGIASGWALREAPQEYRLEALFSGARNSKTKGGKLSSPFQLVVESNQEQPGRYEFTGSIKELQKALRNVKFSPDTSLDDDPVLTIRLEGKPVNPVLVGGGSFPIVITRRLSAGSCKPFEKLQIAPARPDDAEPRFCGKCLLKLRGWRVMRTPGPVLGPPAIAVPDRNRAVPINGRMIFDGYRVQEGDVTFVVNGADKTVTFGLDAKDPGANRVPLGPFAFLHSHTYTWQSSTGNLDDLSGLMVRELVLYRAPTQNAPFNLFADPDQRFAQTGGSAKDGMGGDTHSMRAPALICARNSGNPVAGTLIGEQWYQYSDKTPYSTDDADWIDMPESAFLLEKSVYKDNKNWVLSFKKSNAPSNPIPYLFEIHYKIGPELSFAPDLTANQFAGASQAVPVRNPLAGPMIMQLVWAAGAQTMNLKSKNLSSKVVTLEILKKKGYAISGTPTP